MQVCVLLTGIRHSPGLAFASGTNDAEYLLRTLCVE
ncbi:hypothetical protein EHW99_0321 [Erwinia amylovora]|uniref:Uncharacterized protein n=3 Tax=Erwinia amylovora TaxID=552 RepID=A0A831EUX1_ERWAM|nr:hypothetical protein EaACW_3319 [Erwinia amylovora ACW56400]QJQ53028.1 hypothetical protein EHX00_0321 [Erwinia amylovora]CBA23397.1 hypothetical protein predicted by Glimmer/Critica [Erwinia amylovora CFBP1430]CBX82181.1 hypothetical protein predicted by Glimmer/Critica [Erwinia amylovora ATCC BAA-2158]CCO80157.1 hypothetical protein BN432_3387 [Erwinia amylovora Ea356]CCO83961.1 hypothetical protein BN433_3413 [Erwinia amylovora Ea266]CCO87723.1 hypothetical protein BN434_3363 [Erwinia a